MYTLKQATRIFLYNTFFLLTHKRMQTHLVINLIFSLTILENRMTGLEASLKYLQRYD